MKIFHRSWHLLTLLLVLDHNMDPQKSLILFSTWLWWFSLVSFFLPSWNIARSVSCSTRDLVLKSPTILCPSTNIAATGELSTSDWCRPLGKWHPFTQKPRSFNCFREAHVPPYPCITKHSQKAPSLFHKPTQRKAFCPALLHGT